MDSGSQEHERWLRTLSSRQRRSDREWSTAFVLSAAAGWLGLDRFYAGTPTLGMLKLFTFGGFGIWWLVDVLLLLSESMCDEERRPIRRRG